MPCLDDVLFFLFFFFFFFSAQHAHVRGNKKKLPEAGDGFWLAGLSDVADSFYDSDIGEN